MPVSLKALSPPTRPSVPAALSQLVSLYLGRSHALWKETAIMAWLEANVHQVLRVVDAKEPVLEEAEQK